MSSLTICTMVWRLSKPWSAAEGLNTRTLATPGRRRRAKASRAGRGGGALVGRGRRQVLVGDAAEQAAGEVGGFLAAAGLQGGGADGVQPVDTRRQCDGHGAAFLPAGGRQTSSTTDVNPASATVGSP